MYAAVGCGLLLRVAALLMVFRLPLDSDARGYYTMALQLLRHERFSPFWPPGLPYFLATFLGLFGEAPGMARIALLLLYPVFCIVLDALIREVVNRRAAHLAVLFFALYPEWIRYSVWPLTELPAAICLAAAVYLLLVALRRDSWVLSAATGLILGALTLTRAGSLLLVGFVPLYILVRTKRRAVALLVLVASLVPIGAWLGKAQAMTGLFVFISDAGVEDFFLGNNPYTPLYRTWPGGQAETGLSPELMHLYLETRSQPATTRDHLFRQMAFDHILSRPDLFLLRTLSRVRTYFAFGIHRGERFKSTVSSWQRFEVFMFLTTCVDAAFYWALMLFALLALFSPRDSLLRREPLALILGVVVTYSIPYWVVFSNPRLHLPILPLLAVPAAAFAGALVTRPRGETLGALATSPRRRRGLIAALAIFVFIQVEWAWVIYLKL